MINRVVLVGRLTKDPELRYTGSNIAVASFTMAVNSSFKNKETNEYEVDFINCVVWKASAENLSKYTRKGSLIGIEGRIKTRNYENNEGKRVYITEVVCDNVRFLDSKSSQESGTIPQGPQNSNNEQLTINKQHDTSINVTDDDLPF